MSFNFSRISLFMFLALGLFAVAQDEDGNKPVAEVKGKTIYMKDVLNDEILKLRHQLFEKMEAAIAEEAAAILENHPHDNDPDHLMDHFRNSVKSGEVKLLIDVPPPPTVKVHLSEAYIRRNPEAPVMIMEFIDSQCPFCREVHPIIERLMRKYRNELAVAIRHYPLDSHPEAMSAAIALECAREQGRFDQLHNALMARPNEQEKQHFLQYAGQVAIADLSSFEDCLDEKRYEARIKEDMAVAESLGIDSTPSFIIGRYDAKTQTLEGEVVEGALEYEEFYDIVNRYLPRKESDSEKPKEQKASDHKGHSHEGHNHQANPS